MIEDEVFNYAIKEKLDKQVDKINDVAQKVSDKNYEIASSHPESVWDFGFAITGRVF